jgi:hypothetical protein
MIFCRKLPAGNRIVNTAMPKTIAEFIPNGPKSNDAKGKEEIKIVKEFKTSMLHFNTKKANVENNLSGENSRENKPM